MDLTELIVPNLKGDFNKARSFTWIDHNTDGVYSVRVYEKLSPAESAGQNSTGTIGWVEVDTIKNQIREAVSNPENPVVMKTDVKKLKNYVDKCLTDHYREKMPDDDVIVTDLPYRSDSVSECFGADSEAAKCTNRYHEYPISWVGADIRPLFDSSATAFLALPSIYNLKLILAAGGYKNVLYVFKDNKLISKEIVAKWGDPSELSFDINKNYLITTYLKLNNDNGAKSKVKEVKHKKLNSDGQFVTCPDSNPACN